MQSYNPPPARRRSLGSSLFARHYSGNHYCFLFLPVLRCFSSRGWLSFEFHVFNVKGWPIRRSRDIMLGAAPPGLSQLTTSFFASQTQGIHHAPLVALKKLETRICYSCSCYPTTFLQTNHKWCDISKLWSIVRYSSNIFFPNMSKNFY